MLCYNDPMANVVVTGGAGFIGKPVVKYLLDKKHKVRVLDNLSKGKYEPVGKEELKRVDLLDSKKTAEYLKKADVCIHMAAKIGGVGYLHKNAATILSENANMLSSVFNGAVEARVKRIIYISSSMVYESATRFPTKEKDLFSIPLPKTSYGFSKLVGEVYCKAYRDQYGLSYTIIRPFNAYGPGEMPAKEVGLAHVIPDFLHKIYSGQYPVEVLGNGRQIRCFTYVDDIARGIVMAVDTAKSKNEDFNIADQTPIAIDNLLKLLWKLSGVDKPLKIVHKKGLEADVQKRIPDASKARRLLKWEPSLTLEDGLRDLIVWYKSSVKTRNTK